MKRATILCVDDEPSILDTLRRMLRNEDWDLLFAGSGAEGLQMLQEKQVDLILADNLMPGMSGIEFLRNARMVQPDAVRIILSGYTDTEKLNSAVDDEEVYRFLSKPWNNEELKLASPQFEGHSSQIRVQAMEQRRTEARAP
ncbi:MAG: response regulator [Dehalococcoidia bacterium]|nr:response regulator [Dehalococcoidia bacterium]